MGRKITISIPDDVAERLESERNVSAYVTDAIQKRMDAERTRHVLTQLGFDLSEEGMEEARQKLDEARAKITPELTLRVTQLLAEASRGRWRPRA